MYRAKLLIYLQDLDKCQLYSADIEMYECTRFELQQLVLQDLVLIEGRVLLPVN
jgi:hypothetical protein